MKRIVREINIRRQRGRDGSYYFFQLFSVNLLGELYWKLPIVIKDTGFGQVSPEESLGRSQSK